MLFIPSRSCPWWSPVSQLRSKTEFVAQEGALIADAQRFPLLAVFRAMLSCHRNCVLSPSTCAPSAEPTILALAAVASVSTQKLKSTLPTLPLQFAAYGDPVARKALFCSPHKLANHILVRCKKCMRMRPPLPQQLRLPFCRSTWIFSAKFSLRGKCFGASASKLTWIVLQEKVARAEPCTGHTTR
eukprot:267404-Rhodomonas_salina.1